MFVVSLYTVGRELLKRNGVDDGDADMGFEHELDDFRRQDTLLGNHGNVERLVNKAPRHNAEDLEMKPNVLDEHMGRLHEMRAIKDDMNPKEGGMDDPLIDEQLMLLNNPPKVAKHDELVRVELKEKAKSGVNPQSPDNRPGDVVRLNITNVMDAEKQSLRKHLAPDLLKPPGKNISVQDQNGKDSTEIVIIMVDHDKFKSEIDRPERAFDPANPLGEMGKPVVFEGEMKKLADVLYPRNAFNLLASDRIAFNRTLPDVRPKQCKSVVFPDGLPTTSVIIIFHNEAFSALLRTVHSVVNRSPRHLLKEVILVDDASTQDHLKRKLDDYLSRHFRSSALVRLERLPIRSGLIRARIHGALAATGDVLTFLDSHCETTDGWLEPLLAVIAKDRRNVVTPTIDVINDRDFAFQGHDDLPYVGSFDWSMYFRWTPIQRMDLEQAKQDPTLPIRTPTMAGGLFSIDKGYFMDIGMYDPGLQTWGAENLELSFKTWMCGGSLYTMSCSHVGHIFRKYAPYTHASGHLNRNTKRIVEVWLDGARPLFYKLNPGVASVDAGDIREQIGLRKKLECKSFQWYLDNVFPESPWPREGSIFGFIRNPDHKVCLKSQQDKKVVAKPCGQINQMRLWEYTKLNEIRQDVQCLDFTGQGELALYGCHRGQGNQLWNWNNSTKQISHGLHGKCLSIASTDNKGTTSLEMAPCLDSNPNQRWEMPPPYNPKLWG
ncbi:polypeptide N-acetylgalactosaminyltransferase 1-like [Lytechinus variegatus]|uniref:polypeptide N-acetylgalactosaminyltransferase 1-like n=1 Tax=Lytechinus variegatus TaxID=7654 RepID=UPI001BB1C04F|nr:polypeptide N-acetylgalactosaminyltransferase 1-like [Lytechinus variegatus]